MPYLMKIITGKEKKVINLFAREGIELSRIPVSEYLVCHDPRCRELRYRDTMEGYIRSLAEISDEEAKTLLAQKTEVTSADEDIEIGSIVTVTEGEYEGQNGIVRRILDDKIEVDIVLYGRMHSVHFKRALVRLAPRPEVWS